MLHFSRGDNVARAYPVAPRIQMENTASVRIENLKRWQIMLLVQSI
jgi:hypothetical protein